MYRCTHVYVYTCHKEQSPRMSAKGNLFSRTVYLCALPSGFTATTTYIMIICHVESGEASREKMGKWRGRRRRWGEEEEKG